MAVLRILLALLAAVAAVVAGWAGLCALGFQAATLASSAAPEFHPEPLPPPPAPLAPIPPPPADALPGRVLPRTGSLIADLGADALSEPAVVGVVDGWSGAPLATADVGAGETAGPVRIDGLPAGELWLALARDRSALRSRYLTRVPVSVAAPPAPPAHAALDPRVYEVVIRLRAEPAASLDAVGVDVARTDDPSWARPRAGGAGMPAPDAEGVVRLHLGRGSYRLVLVGFEPSAPPPTFAVPAITALNLVGSATP